MGKEKEWKEKGCSQSVSILIGIFKEWKWAPEDEENFEEAIKNVNTALNTTQVLRAAEVSPVKGVFWSPRRWNSWF